MSKNIEVLLRAREATALPWSKSTPRESQEVKRTPVPIEPIGDQSGEADLVQRVFLLSPDDVPRVVAFCGVGQTDGAGVFAFVRDNFWLTRQARRCVSSTEASIPPL